MRFLFILFLLIGAPVWAQELNNPNKLKPCPKDQNVLRDNCWGTYIFSNGDRYVGAFKDNKKQGQGTYHWIGDSAWKGDKYIGEYKNDQFHGQGTYIYSTGNKYVGEWKEHNKNGQGTYTFVNGDKYVGEYKNDKRHGQGTYIEANGNKYIGEWKENKKNGQGTFTFTDGEKYVGEFKSDQFHGQGSYTFASGNRYVGEWKESKKHGQGTFTFVSGNKHVGEYKNDEKNGQGVFLFADGSKDIGEFIGNDLNGRGLRISADGSVYESGIYKDDKLVDSFKVDPLSFTRIPRQYLVVEKNPTNTEPPAPVVTNKTDNAETIQTNTSPAATDSRRRFALVIGNSSYNSLPKLPNASNDARAITQSLRSAGFQVSAHENLDLAGMQNAIRGFGEKLGKNDVGLVYYAGHGVQVKGKNYLIPIKENIKKSFEVPSSAVDVDLVLATLENIKNDLNIVVLDACRSSFPGEARGTNRGLATIEAAKGTFIAFATAPGKEALDGSGSNSPYTKHLARLIGKKGLPLEQVFKEVRKAVVAETNGEQVPWENSSLMGDFYFQK